MRQEISGQLSILGLCNLFCQLVQQSIHFWIVVLGLIYFAACVHNGSMVASAQMTADFFEAVPGKVPRQIHTNLTWFGDALAASLALQIR